MHGIFKILLLLHSTFMLCVVKMPLKLEVGGLALNSHGNYIIDNGKSWNCVFEFLWEPCGRKHWVIYAHLKHIGLRLTL